MRFECVNSTFWGFILLQAYELKAYILVGANKALLVDAGGAVVSGILGTSPVTSFVESNVGVEMGGRTGLTAVVTGILFLLSIFAYPIFSIFASHR